MPNIKQQARRVATTERQRQENLRWRSTVKTLRRRLENAVEEGDADRIAGEHGDYVRWIDRLRPAAQFIRITRPARSRKRQSSSPAPRLRTSHRSATG